MRTTIAAIGAALALVGCTAATDQNPAAPECDYDCALETHLGAIAEGDWEAFEATITAQPDIQLVLPDGTLVEGREAYLELLQPWLTEGGFEWETETIDQRVGTDLGYTLLRVHQTVTAESRESTYYLLLVFALEDGEWRLVHDQNTAIAPEVLAVEAESAPVDAAEDTAD